MQKSASPAATTIDSGGVHTQTFVKNLSRDAKKKPSRRKAGEINLDELKPEDSAPVAKAKLGERLKRLSTVPKARK
jgi:hypothetical protein